MGRHKRVDPDTEAALAVVEMERKQEELKRAEQERREFFIAQCHEVIGRVQANTLAAKFGAVANLVWLKQIKESKQYRDLPSVGTWDKFCEYLHLDRRTVDEDLQNLAVLGQEFLATCRQLSVGYRDLRKLRQLTAGGDVSIDAECVVIGEERIPLDQEHTEDLQAAIESLLEAKNRTIEDQHASLKAKDKVLRDKEHVINKHAKKIAELEGTAEKAGYGPGEEAFLAKVSTALVTIDGFLMQFDPERNPLPEDATSRMKASFMETLGYFKRVTDAAFDTAADLYGDPEIDDDWIPPHKRDPKDMTPEMRRALGIKEAPSASGTLPQPLPTREGRIGEMGEGEIGDCTKCLFHKAVGNKAHQGMRIPGGFGKCIRPEGHCSPAHPSN